LSKKCLVCHFSYPRGIRGNFVKSRVSLIIRGVLSCFPRRGYRGEIEEKRTDSVVTLRHSKWRIDVARGRLGFRECDRAARGVSSKERSPSAAFVMQEPVHALSKKPHVPDVFLFSSLLLFLAWIARRPINLYALLRSGKCNRAPESFHAFASPRHCGQYGTTKYAVQDNRRVTADSRKGMYFYFLPL